MKLFIGIIVLFGIIYLLLKSKHNPYEEDYVVNKSMGKVDKREFKDRREMDRLNERMHYHEMNGRHATTDHTKAEVLGQKLNSYDNPLASSAAPPSYSVCSTTLKR